MMFRWMANIKVKKTASMVLMYHRVDDGNIDPWQLSVSPKHFEKQLLVLQKTGRVKPLSYFQSRLERKEPLSNAILLTFDDGYADNSIIARPLLEKYELPATFFIPTKYLGQEQSLWWDELAFILLQKKTLPRFLTIRIANNLSHYDLSDEANMASPLMKLHEKWNATLPPPSARSMVYLAIWQILTPLPPILQEEVMQQVRTWAESDTVSVKSYKLMTPDQVTQLAQTGLFTIGAHTHSHPALPEHPKHFQKEELLKNKKLLEELSGKEINALAYPSGRYNDTTISVAKSLGFNMAFTTSSKLLTPFQDPYQLGRYPVNDWEAKRFSKEINQY